MLQNKHNPYDLDLKEEYPYLFWLCKNKRLKVNELHIVKQMLQESEKVHKGEKKLREASDVIAETLAAKFNLKY